MRKYFFLMMIATAVYLGIQEFRNEAGLISDQAQIESVPGPSAPQLAAVPPGPRLPGLTTSEEAVSEDPVIRAAQNYLLKHKDELNLQDHHHLRPQVFSSPLGSTVRFDVYQDGLPLLGAYIDVEMDADRQISSMTSHYEPYERVETETKEVLSMEEIRTKLPVRYGSLAGEAPSLMLLPSGAGSNVELVYVMRFSDKEQNGRPVQILFRATDGQILRKSMARTEFQK